MTKSEAAKSEKAQLSESIEKIKSENATNSIKLENVKEEIKQIQKDHPSIQTSGDAMMASQSVFSMGGMQEKIEDLKHDFSEDNMFQQENPFASQQTEDPFAVVNTTSSDPFNQQDDVTEDPFADSKPHSDDPFAPSNQDKDEKSDFFSSTATAPQ